MKVNKLIINFLVINLLINSAINDGSRSYAQYTQDQSNQMSNPDYARYAAEYYQRGIDFYKSNEYTKSIAEFEQALKLNPFEPSIKTNLAAAHIARGSYFYKIDLNKAANDYRRAIFYLKYDENAPDSYIAKDNIQTAETNLKNLLIQHKISLSPKSRLKIAKELRGQGNFKDAAVEYNEALADANLKLEVYEALGDIMRVIQKDNKSAEYYQNALSINPDNAELHLKLARALNQTGNIDAAVKEFNIALNLNANNKEIIVALENIWKTRLTENPQDAVAHMNLGVVFQKKGDLQAALAEYKLAESLEPNNLTIRLNLGTLFQALGDIQMALRAYDTILQVNPADSTTHYYRATALKQMGNIKEAIDEFQIVLQIDPNHANAKKSMFEAVKEIQDPNESLFLMDKFSKMYEKDALIQYNYAYELHSKKKNDEALLYYQKAINNDPKLIDAYLNTASIYKEKKQNLEAILTLQNALVANPDNSRIKNMLSEIKEETSIARYEQAVKKHNQGDYEGAIQDYIRIIEENESSPELYVSLGAAYQAIDNLEKAISSYNKALEQDKTNTTALYYLGTIYYSQKNYEKSLIYYQKAIAADPENGDINEAIKAAKIGRDENILNNGLNEYNSQRYSKALEIFNQAISLNTENGYAYYYRGMVYDAQKKYLLAIEDYKKALSKSSDLILAYYALGVDYDLLNLKSDAKNAYQKFVNSSKDQNDEYVKYAKQRLQKL